MLTIDSPFATTAMACGSYIKDKLPSLLPSSPSLRPFTWFLS